MATPEEIAEIIAFLCSPAGRCIRGQNLIYDGGVGTRPMSLEWIIAAAIPPA